MAKSKKIEEEKEVKIGKQAVAYIDSDAIIELLKIPFNVRLASLTYPAKDHKVKLVLEGDPLPVDPVGKGEELPEVTYKLLRHWHNAGIVPK